MVIKALNPDHGSKHFIESAQTINDPTTNGNWITCNKN